VDTFCGLLVNAVIDRTRGGIVLATINWFRLGLKHKAAWHLGLGLAFSFVYKYFLYRDLDAQPAVRLLIDLCLSLVIAIYLDKQLETDYQRYQKQGASIERANWLIAVGVALLAGAVVTIVSGFFAYRSITAQWASLHNHVYCELLTPGMTVPEVNAALSTLSTAGQTDWHKIPETASNQVKRFRTVVWDDFDLEWNNRLHVGLGYDIGDRLVWKSIRVGVTSFVTVDCPVTLDNIAYRR
jgi:hypothetical protein